MKYLKKITPFALLFLAAVTGFIYLAVFTHVPGEAKGIMGLGLLILAIAALCVDVLLRLIFREKVHYIWIGEAAIFVIFVYILIIT
ncbi:hypothetical protein [Foetidibacter luteolus]|uniref:hypothetical protein n=1 Tax=Foetidibacter luteolus TaxID=2608880 RepID=UPI00129AF3A8|nr:hypothetical protein [Foetidibacter luteolus]